MKFKKSARAKAALRVVPCLLVTGFSGAAAAETPAPTQLEEMVISALRKEIPREKSTSAVSVLDPRDLENQGITRLQDALNQSPGVISVSTAGAPGAIGSLLIRGMRTGQSQIVVDGVRINDSTLDLGNFLGSAKLNDVSRVEVLRGPQSALYGGEAMGGVVVLETARGEKNFSELRTEAGSFQTQSVSLSNFGKIDKLSWFVGGGYDATANDLEHNDFTQGRFATRLEFAPQEHVQVGFTFRTSRSYYESPAYAAAFVDAAENWTNSTLATLYANVQHSAEWSSRSRIGYYTQEYDNRTSGAFPATYGTDFEQLSFSSDHTYQIDEQQSLVGGVVFENAGFDRDSSYNPGEIFHKNRNRYGAYLGHVGTWTERWTTNALLRWEDYASFGKQVTWRAATAYQIPLAETTLRAGLGRAFRAPSYTDLYYVGPYQVGNPNLNAETSLGWDVGLEKEWLPKQLVSVTYFQNNAKDAINSFAFPRPENLAGTTRTAGMEFGANGRFADDQFGYRAAWTFLDRDSIGAPRHSATASLDARVTDKWTLGVGGTFLDRRSWGKGANFVSLESAFVARVFTEYQVTDALKLTARVENLFNERWAQSDIFGQRVPAPGIGYFGGLTFTW